MQWSRRIVGAICVTFVLVPGVVGAAGFDNTTRVTVTPSASFGVASSASSGYDLARLLAHADAALYRAKRAGRDCVMAYDVAESGEVQAIALSPPQA